MENNNTTQILIRMRTPRAAAQYFKQRDPETAISETAIRRAIKIGQLPCRRAGCKQLISLDAVEKYFSGESV